MFDSDSHIRSVLVYIIECMVSIANVTVDIAEINNRLHDLKVPRSALPKEFRTQVAVARAFTEYAVE